MSGAESLAPTTPTLRRKRSSANAALTSRPSSLSLRDSNINGGTPISASSPLRLSSAVPTLSISLPNVVLIHTSTSPEGHTSLAHALFTPDFFIDGSGRSIRLGREVWERVRDSVEGMRFIGRRRSSAAATPDKTSASYGSGGLIAPEDSPNRKHVPGVVSSVRWFSVAPDDATVSSRPTSTLLIQPGQANEAAASAIAVGSTSLTARSASELLAFQVYGVGDDAEVSPAAWAKLPTQIRTLLQEAEGLTVTAGGGPKHSDAMDIDEADIDGDDVCKAVLALLQQ